jgi:hypothetical protein
MSIVKGFFVLCVAALTICGCKSEGSTGAAAGAAVPGASASTVSTGSTGTRQEFVADPTLSMNAFAVMAPAAWHFQGVLEQGGQCVPTPFAVFRATSPDGLSFMERMPTMGWAWGTGFQATVKHPDCLPLKGLMSAQDYLKYLASTMKVEYVSDDPVPTEVNAKAQQLLAAAEAEYAPKYAAIHMQPPKSTRQLANAVVRFQNGTFAMKGYMWTEVDCRETQMPAVMASLSGVSDVCAATVRYLVAPENQFAAVAKLWRGEDTSMTGLAAWQQAWVARNNQQTQLTIARMNQISAAQRAASAQQFAHSQAVQQQMHNQFLATMQEGTDRSMAAAAQVANTNHTIVSDWVDYSLDQKTVMDPGTGQVSKVSSAYNYTWVDSTGKTSFQTNDGNANPNGALQGNWTRQQTVHGDGTL